MSRPGVTVVVLSNPRSERNKAGMADVERCLAGRPEVIHLVFAAGMDLAAALADLAGRLWYRATPERAVIARRQLDERFEIGVRS